MHATVGHTRDEFEATRHPVVVVILGVAGFIICTVPQALPGAFPAMFLRGPLLLRPAEIGILSGILFGGMMVAGPIAGRLADRFGRKYPLVGAALVLTIGSVLMGWHLTIRDFSLPA